MQNCVKEDPLELLSFDAAAVVIRASQRDGGETLQKVKEFADRLKHYASLIVQQEHEDEDTAADASVGDNATPDEDKKPAARNTHSSSTTTSTTAAANAVTPPNTRSRATATRKRKDKADAEEQQDLAAPPAEKRSRRPATVPTVTQQQRQPRNLLRGYSGQLIDSKLRRSEGHTRKILNQHLSALGLHACFANGVVSKHGNVVSHLTFSSDWNDLPRTTNETLEWWLGTGPSRLELASPLDPNNNNMIQPAIPIFWAEPQNTSTTAAALCHYIGHYQCVRFEKVQQEVVVVVKGERRQALLEFQFVKFDERLSTKISLIGKK